MTNGQNQQQNEQQRGLDRLQTELKPQDLINIANAGHADLKKGADQLKNAVDPNVVNSKEQMGRERIDAAIPTKTAENAADAGQSDFDRGINSFDGHVNPEQPKWKIWKHKKGQLASVAVLCLSTNFIGRFGNNVDPVEAQQTVSEQQISILQGNINQQAGVIAQQKTTIENQKVDIAALNAKLANTPAHNATGGFNQQDALFMQRNPNIQDNMVVIPYNFGASKSSIELKGMNTLSHNDVMIILGQHAQIGSLSDSPTPFAKNLGMDNDVVAVIDRKYLKEKDLESYHRLWDEAVIPHYEAQATVISGSAYYFLLTENVNEKGKKEYLAKVVFDPNPEKANDEQQIHPQPEP